MIYLATQRYKKTRHFKYKEKEYWPISPFGDGNCGLYAFACGLLHNMLTDELTLKLTLEPERFNNFIRYIQEFSSALHRPLNLNENIESDISTFLKLINQPNLTFEEFQNFFIKRKDLLTRDSVIAFNLICNQALRRIGFESYKETLIDIPEEDKILSQNCICVGEDILTPLAHYFGIHVKLIFLDCPGKDGPSLDNNIATFTLLLKGGHWHYLLPIEQTLGLAAILPLEQKLELAAILPPANKQRRYARQLSHSEVKIDIEDKKNPSEQIRRTSRDILHENEELIQAVKSDAQKPCEIKDKKNPPEITRRTSKALLHENEELIQAVKSDKQKPFDSTKTTVDNLLKRLKQFFKNIKNIFDFDDELNQTEEFKKPTKEEKEQAKAQSKTFAEESNQTINSWREEWNVSNHQDELDRHLNGLGLHLELEKELIKKPLTTDTSDDPAIVADAAVAAILQNADIADFLSRNYTTLKKRTSSISTNNCSSDIRDHNQSVMAHDQKIAALYISV